MAQQKGKTFQLRPDRLTVILLQRQFGACQQMHRLTKLLGAEAINCLGGHGAAVLPDAMFIEQGAQRHVGRLAFQGVEQ
ncbi:hypothetical protein D3C72_1849510 [compost metagenome]